MKKKILYFILFSFLIIIVFNIGIFCRYIIHNRRIITPMPTISGNLSRSLHGYVYSEIFIEKQIEDIFHINVPTNATNMYCAVNGFFDCEFYAALTLPTQEDCEKFLESQFNITTSDLIQKNTLPESFINNGPNRWPCEYKCNWDAEEYKNYLYLYNPIDYGDLKILYVSEICRLFIFDKE